MCKQSKRIMKKKKSYRKILVGLSLIVIVGIISVACNNELQDTAALGEDDPLVQVAELSSQLSSGTDITIAITDAESGRNGERPDGASYGNRPTGSGDGKPDGASYGDRPSSSGGGRPDGASYGGRQGGMGFQQYNDDPKLLVLSIADRIGGRLNFGFFASLGAEVTHYDENGGIIELEQTGRPAWGSWADENMLQIAQTIIDFGEGLNLDRGTVSLSFSGKITIDRSYDDDELSEVLTFEGFSINDASIEGTNAVVRSFNEDTSEGSLSSIITDGKITFADGTSADWVSTKNRSMSIVIEEGEDKPTSATSTSDGETTVTTSDGEVFYSHTTTSPIVSDMSCSSHGRKPSSGTVETIYGENTITIDFGDGQCSSSVTITLNGTTITREVRGG